MAAVSRYSGRLKEAESIGIGRVDAEAGSGSLCAQEQLSTTVELAGAVSAFIRREASEHGCANTRRAARW